MYVFVPMVLLAEERRHFVVGVFLRVGVVVEDRVGGKISPVEQVVGEVTLRRVRQS